MMSKSKTVPEEDCRCLLITGLTLLAGPITDG